MTVAQRIASLHASIIGALQDNQRQDDDVTLLAVGKGQTSATLLQAHAAGINDFAENYLQEAFQKIVELKAYPLCWHFIGKIQSNKTALIAQHFTWVHTLDSFKIAQRLSLQRPSHLPALACCIQVNIDDDPQKNGIASDALLPLALAIAELPRLQLRGLMTMTHYTTQLAEQRAAFAQLRQAKDEVVAAGVALDTLSMGTSHDYVAALAEGATILRLGTAIFGARTT